jgi:diguanylate cyclase (GGDEF)-like protein/PAS domain S-box-containing protein
MSAGISLRRNLAGKLALSVCVSVMKLLFRKPTNQIASVLDDLPQGVCLFDAKGQLVIANKRYVEMYGMSPSVVVPGCTLRDLVVHRKALGVLSEDVDVYCRGVMADIAKGKTVSRSIELADGRIIHTVNRPLVGDGWIATHEDITERKIAQEKLTQEINENRRLFETSLDLILVTNRLGLLERVSPISLSTLGYSPEEMIGHYGSDFVYPADLENTRTEMRLARKGRHMRNFETRYVHKSGKVVTIAWSGVWSEPEQKHFFTGRDVSDKKAFEEKLSYLAHFDPLTGLANRLSLQNDLEQALGSSPTSIAMFDLDGFKDINDTLGHSTGDKLLQSVAVRMREAEREGLRFYRLGGDEFVLVQSHCGDPRIVGQSVTATLRRLAGKFEVGGHTLFIGASAGIAIAPTDGSNVESLMSSADLALYDAKAAGGNTYRLFLPALRAKATARRELDAELRRACANHEFELYFQPQVRTDDGALVGAEALLRWRHPERGVLAPGAFIDALSESPVVLEVGRWILSAACEQAARWRIAGQSNFRIGVNLFPAQFHAKTLYTDVETALQATGLPADALEIEITENIALGEQQENLEAVRTLRQSGVRFAFDDFGTGYASLSYLTRYPLNRLKIDQSFVRKISESSTLEDTAIVRSIVAMAHNLGLEVIAEGVETEVQAAFLRKEKCEELQGYLYGKPMPKGEFEGRYLRSFARAPFDLMRA